METFTPMAAAISSEHSAPQHVPTPKCLPIEDLPYFKPGKLSMPRSHPPPPPPLLLLLP